MENNQFCIKDYLWYIFEIKDTQKQTSFMTAYDMFISNLNLKTERYKGATGLKYRKVRSKWRRLSLNKKASQKLIFNEYMNSNIFLTLYNTYILGDKETFISIINSID